MPAAPDPAEAVPADEVVDCPVPPAAAAPDIMPPALREEWRVPPDPVPVALLKLRLPRLLS